MSRDFIEIVHSLLQILEINAVYVLRVADVAK
jgi:hypothetical protein